MLQFNENYCLLDSVSLEEYQSKRLPDVLDSSQLSQYARQVNEYTNHVEWLCFNSSDSEFDCCHVAYIYCHEGGPALPFGYCATYSETKRMLSTFKCLNLQWNDYNMTNPWYVTLPVSLTELNDYMCGPLNRKGVLCSECADGFGPSVTSYEYKCVNCTNAWYHIPRFFLVQFVPSTILYIIILVFRISVVSPPMPSIFFCIQAFVLGFYMTFNSGNPHNHAMLFTEDGLIRLDMKIIRIIHSFLNQLNVLRYAVPPICLSTKLKQIHVYLFSYISVFYPILLIILTWVCVNLHDNNVRPFVWLWRPFNKCIVRLRRQWDIKSDLVDAFITFYLLSYIKSAHQAVVLLVDYITIHNVDQTGSKHYKLHLFVDPSVDYFGQTHLPIALTAIFLFLIFNILPALLLILYPFGTFRNCLSKCRLDFIAVNIFADKIQCYYRNGLDGGKDMRCFSGLYLYLWIGLLPIVIIFMKEVLNSNNVLFSIAVGFLIMATILAVAKPYQRMYMNYIDTLLTLCVALQYFSISSGVFRLARVLICIPLVVLFLMITVKPFKKCVFSVKAPLKKCCSFCLSKLQRSALNCDKESSDTDNSEAQPLINPTMSEISCSY